MNFVDVVTETTLMLSLHDFWWSVKVVNHQKKEMKENPCRQSGGKRLFGFMPISNYGNDPSSRSRSVFNDFLETFHGWRKIFNDHSNRHCRRSDFTFDLNMFHNCRKLWFVFNCAVGINFEWSFADLSKMQMKLKILINFNPKK